MLSRCANPLCSKTFQYLSEGKLFQVELESEALARLGKTAARKHPGRIERFWLCKECATELTLVFAPGTGVIVAPIEKPRRAAAS